MRKKSINDDTSENDIDYKSGDFEKQLIKEINTDKKDRVAYNLIDDASPTEISGYISTGSVLLDYAVSNKRNGGIPLGRVTEISGQESTGKSLLGLEILKNVQKMGGIAILLDTENATNPELLQNIGIDLNRFIYAQPDYIESCFDVIEKIIKKVHTTKADRPVAIVWDSIAATPPRDELMGDYEDNTMGLAARKLAQGLRKITQTVGTEKISFVLINQLKHKIGMSAMYGDPMVSFGGKAIPYHSSVRIQLGARGKIEGEGKKDDIIGVGVRAKVIKNKIACPFRTAEFDILFNIGISEGDQIFDALSSVGKISINGRTYKFSKGAWSGIEVSNGSDIILDEKFRSKEFYEKYIKNENADVPIFDILEKICIRNTNLDAEYSSDSVIPLIDVESVES